MAGDLAGEGGAAGSGVGSTFFAASFFGAVFFGAAFLGADFFEAVFFTAGFLGEAAFFGSVFFAGDAFLAAICNECQYSTIELKGTHGLTLLVLLLRKKEALILFLRIVDECTNL